jgi:uncharacterized integral membrane protein
MLVSTSMHTPEQTEHVEKPRRSARERSRTIATVGLAILITVFAVLNVEEVKVDWIVGSGHAPLIIVIVVSMLVGIALSHFSQRRAGRRRR